MKFRSAVRRSSVIIFILVASVLIGYGYQLFCEYRERQRTPKRFEEFVERYSAEFSVPEYMLYAVMSVQSGFDSDLSSGDGRLGLMQIGEDTLAWVNDALHENIPSSRLADPETNIRCGTYYLAWLYFVFGRWTPTLAAFETSADMVTFWSLESEYSDGNGNLLTTPYEELNEKIARIEALAETYQELYY